MTSVAPPTDHAASEEPQRSGPDKPVRSPGLWSWATATWAPLTAYALGHVIYWAAAAHTKVSYRAAASHYRWDSVHYSSIADSGYVLFRCTDRPELVKWGPNAWCGNAGWFPLYPWVVRVARVTGLTTSQAGWLIAEMAGLTLVLVLWSLLTRRGTGAVGQGRSLAVLGVAVVLPAGVYYHAIFPMSLAAAAMLFYVALLSTSRWIWAGLAGAAATMAYPTGGLVAVIGLVTVAVLVVRRQLALRAALGAWAAVCGIPLLAFLAVLGFMQVTLGHWDAYMRVQAKYGGQERNPATTFTRIVGSDLDTPLTSIVRLEMWATLALVLLACAAAIMAWRRRQLTAVDAGLAAFAILMFLAPLSAGTHVSQYRVHTLLLPIFVLLRHLPSWVLWVLAVALLPLAYRMGTLFFSSLLV